MSYRRVPLALIRALTVLGLIALSVGPVTAASSKPTVTLATNVSGSSATVSAEVNRGKQQIATCKYVLDAAPAVACGAATSQGNKATRYTLNLTSQSVGGHTITVTIVLTDRGVGSKAASFTIVAPAVRAFVVAFTNLDGVAGYGAGDALIARLVDTNGDDAVSVGDTIEVGTFPGDLTNGSRVAVGVSTHIVTSVSVVLASAVLVTSDGGSSEYFWSTIGGATALYSETANPALNSQVSESSSNCSFGLVTSSPSRPVTGVATAGPCSGDLVELAFDVS